MERQLETRNDVLVCFAANGEVVDELLRYNENRFQDAAIDLAHCPLLDESFVATWREYARQTDETWSINALGKYLVQRWPHAL